MKKDRKKIATLRAEATALTYREVLHKEILRLKSLSSQTQRRKAKRLGHS